MKLRFRSAVLLIAVMSISACFAGAGVDDDKRPVFQCAYPCTGQPGDQITVDGLNFNLDPAFPADILIGGKKATVVSRTNDRMVVIVPPGTGHGFIFASSRFGQSTLGGDFTYGAQTVVAEVEPNDSVDGANATLVGANTEASGSLSSPQDKDHFKFDCLCANRYMRLTITPRVVPVIYINGTAHAVGANGVVDFIAPPSFLDNSQALIGVTGATGNYTLKMSVL